MMADELGERRRLREFRGRLIRIHPVQLNARTFSRGILKQFDGVRLIGMIGVGVVANHLDRFGRQ